MTMMEGSHGGMNAGPLQAEERESGDDPTPPPPAITEVRLADDSHIGWTDELLPEPPYEIHIHEEILDGLGTEQLDKRLALVSDHLAAFGRPSVAKPCAGVNKGWLRTPMGGNHGNHYYLWWRRRPANDESGRRSILLRSVRHHDDHRPLDEGQPSAYHRLRRGAEFACPWTEPQHSFIWSEAPIRILHGWPGSGKTSCLWLATEREAGEYTLYVTWSHELAQVAESRFATFAPTNSTIRAIAFTTLLGELTGCDVPSIPLEVSFERFRQRFDRIPDASLAPWSQNPRGLYAEIRAHLLGGIAPLQEDDGERWHLDKPQYVAARARDGLSERACHAAYRVFQTLSDQDAWSDVFPELVAAREAIRILLANGLPAGFAELNRIVLDEVQDLTVLEFSVVISLTRMIGQISDTAPFLLLAGDEGQTVRPTAFDWGRTNELLGIYLGRPDESRLDEIVRCPERIASVVEQVAQNWRRLDRGIRPGKGGRLLAHQYLEAETLRVVVDRRQDAVSLLNELSEIEGVLVVSASSEAPAWLAGYEELREAVLTPAQVKGLEFQSVCVLDAGPAFLRLDEVEHQEKGDASLALAYRAAVDQLCVAISRATERLVFLDVTEGVNPATVSDWDHALSGCQLAPCDPEDLLERFTDDESTPEERCEARCRQAKSLVAERPLRAWSRVLQAWHMLGSPHLPNGVADPEIRFYVARTTAEIAARLLTGARLQGDTGQIRKAANLRSVAVEALEAIGATQCAMAFSKLCGWFDAPAGSDFNVAIDLLDAYCDLDVPDKWFSGTLVPIVQTLRQAIDDAASSPRGAGRMLERVGRWLEATNYHGDIAGETRRLRDRAFDTCLRAGATEDLELAGKILESLADKGSLIQKARLSEALGNYREAANLYGGARRHADAVRCYRALAEWESAKKEATLISPADRSTDIRDIEALIRFEETVKNVPDGLWSRLHPEEVKKLRKSARGFIRAVRDEEMG